MPGSLWRTSSQVAPGLPSYGSHGIAAVALAMLLFPVPSPFV